MDKNMKTLVLGAGGFIGSHLVKKLKKQGHWVKGVDLKYPVFSRTTADEFLIGDLRKADVCKFVFDREYDEVYQLAADMGGAGYVFIGKHDADVMSNSALINLNVAKHHKKIRKLFFSSSACVYSNIDTKEINAKPDSEYGWEKYFSERMYLSFKRNYGLNVRIGRLHNIFGEEGIYQGGKEKSPAAICRKVIQNEKEIEIWGDGEQLRSFLYIDECLEGIEKLMASNYSSPLNIGSTETVTINQLAKMAMEFKGKKLEIIHIDGPQGVRERTSDNTLIKEVLGWQPSRPLKDGLLKTYQWINYDFHNNSNLQIRH